jgi:hypothetical protein
MTDVLSGKEQAEGRKNIHHAYGTAEVPLQEIATHLLKAAKKYDQDVLHLSCYPVNSSRLPIASNLYDALSDLGVRDFRHHIGTGPFPLFDQQSEW